MRVHVRVCARVCVTHCVHACSGQAGAPTRELCFNHHAARAPACGGCRPACPCPPPPRAQSQSSGSSARGARASRLWGRRVRRGGAGGDGGGEAAVARHTTGVAWRGVAWGQRRGLVCRGSRCTHPPTIVVDGQDLCLGAAAGEAVRKHGAPHEQPQAQHATAHALPLVPFQPERAGKAWSGSSYVTRWCLWHARRFACSSSALTRV